MLNTTAAMVLCMLVQMQGDDEALKTEGSTGGDSWNSNSAATCQPNCAFKVRVTGGNIVPGVRGFGQVILQPTATGLYRTIGPHGWTGDTATVNAFAGGPPVIGRIAPFNSVPMDTSTPSGPVTAFYEDAAWLYQDLLRVSGANNSSLTFRPDWGVNLRQNAPNIAGTNFNSEANPVLFVYEINLTPPTIPGVLNRKAVMTFDIPLEGIHLQRVSYWTNSSTLIHRTLTRKNIRPAVVTIQPGPLTTNGGFETPAIGTLAWTQVTLSGANASTLTGWTGTRESAAGSFPIANRRGLIGNAGPYSAWDGAQTVVMTEGARIESPTYTEIGHRYRLTFYARQESGSPSSDPFSVRLGGALHTFTRSNGVFAGTRSGQTWLRYRAEIVSTRTSTASDNLQLTNPVAVAGGIWLIDTVSVEGVWVETDPAPRTAPCGGSATFSFGSDGSNREYQWLRNDAPIFDGPSGGGSTYSGAKSASLTITNCGTYDVANYSCIVHNKYGGATTATAQFSLSCISDVDNGSGTGQCDGGVTIEDLLYYLNIFDAGRAAADVDNGEGNGVRDGGVTIEDLLYFLTRFDAGC